MHTIVMWLGGILVACGAIFFVMIIIAAGTAGRGPQTLVYAAGFCLSFVVSGALLYCFGAIVQHLIAIRSATERQAAVLDRLGQPRS